MLAFATIGGVSGMNPMKTLLAACIGLDGRPRKPPPGMAAALAPYFAADEGPGVA